MGSSGLEPPTSCLSGTRSNHLSYEPLFLRVFSRFLRFPSFLSHLVEMMGFEPMTLCLQGRCSPNWATPPYWFVLFSFSFDSPWKLNNNVRSYSLLPSLFFRFLCFLSRFQVTIVSSAYFLHRKEVIQPHLPIRLPCYDLTPIIGPTLDSCPLAVSSLALGVPNFHGLTGGVYKARERIHRGMLIRDY